MAHRALPFQYEVEKKSDGMPGLAGLPLYVEFARMMGLPRLIGCHVKARQGEQGWTDEQMIMALILLNLAGGDCVDDLKVLESAMAFAGCSGKENATAVHGRRGEHRGQGSA